MRCGRLSWAEKVVLILAVVINMFRHTVFPWPAPAHHHARHASKARRVDREPLHSARAHGRGQARRAGRPRKRNCLCVSVWGLPRQSSPERRRVCGNLLFSLHYAATGIRYQRTAYRGPPTTDVELLSSTISSSKILRI